MSWLCRVRDFLERFRGELRKFRGPERFLVEIFPVMENGGRRCRMAESEFQKTDDVEILVIGAGEFPGGEKVGRKIFRRFDLQMRNGKKVRSEMQCAKSQIEKADVRPEIPVEAFERAQKPCGINAAEWGSARHVPHAVPAAERTFREKSKP